MQRRFLAAMPVLMALACGSMSALGQSRPADDLTPRDPRVRQPDRDPYVTQPVSPSYDFPSTEVGRAVDANARAAFARATYHRAQWALDTAVRDQQRSFERSPELQDALKAEQQAWENYLMVRDSALRPVRDDAHYQANEQLKNQLGDRIADRRAEKASLREIVAMAEVKLDYAQVNRDMEIAALANNTAVREAQRKLMDAGARVQALRQRFDDSIRGNKELIALRQAIDDARVAYITSEAYRNGAVEAANQSLDYSYWKNRYNFNYNNYGYPYGYSPYGTAAVYRY